MSRSHVCDASQGKARRQSGSGPPVIPIALGSTVVNAAYLAGSGTTTLTFRYTVAAGDVDTDGISAAASISLGGGTIRDGPRARAPAPRSA